MNVFLDSYALLELLEGSEKGGRVRQLIKENGVAYTSALNLYEVKYRLFEKMPAQKATELLEYIIANTKLLPVTETSALEAAEWKLKKRVWGAVDCNTYAIAMENQMQFITGDKEFEGVSNVILL